MWVNADIYFMADICDQVGRNSPQRLSTLCLPTFVWTRIWARDGGQADCYHNFRGLRLSVPLQKLFNEL